MRIAICDSYEEDIEETKSLLIVFTKKYSFDIEVICFNTTEELLEDTSCFDIVFLESKYPKSMNGIELGKQLKLKDQQNHLIFLTRFHDLMGEGYKIHAERYLMKPISQDCFNSELISVIAEYRLARPYLTDSRLKVRTLYYSDINYIEHIERKTHVHYLNKVTDTSITLTEWLELLKLKPFIKSHNSYIVNLEKVAKIEFNQVVLLNNEAIPLSRGCRKKFTAVYFAMLNRKSQ